MKKILAFSGSNSSRSINQKLVTAAARSLDQCTATLLDIRDYPMPIYSIDIEENKGFPENAEKLKRLFSEHDGFLIACPENNGSMPVVFKNLIDWLSRMEGKIFEDKPVALLSTSPGKGGGKTNLDNLEKLVPWWGGKVVSALSIGGFYDVFDDAAMTLTDAQLQDALAKAVRELEAVTLADAA